MHRPVVQLLFASVLGTCEHARSADVFSRVLTRLRGDSPMFCSRLRSTTGEYVHKVRTDGSLQAGKLRNVKLVSVVVMAGV